MPRTHARAIPRLPEDDRLLDNAAVARRLGIHPKNVAAYVERWPMLREGVRVVRVRAGTRGKRKVLRSALVEHVTIELRLGEEVASS